MQYSEGGRTEIVTDDDKEKNKDAQINRETKAESKKRRRNELHGRNKNYVKSLLLTLKFFLVHLWLIYGCLFGDDTTDTDDDVVDESHLMFSLGCGYMWVRVCDFFLCPMAEVFLHIAFTYGLPREIIVDGRTRGNVA